MHCPSPAVVVWVAAAAVVACVLPGADATYQVKCDITIAGGATSALATALTAAAAAPTKSVCLLEPTDWPGGQLTSSAVSAIDFGVYNRIPANLPHSFNQLVKSVTNDANMCWVSTTCYPPAKLVHGWIAEAIRNATNLQVYLNTVVTSVGRSGSQIVNITAVQRTAKSTPWTKLLSQELADWYSPEESTAFSKQQLQFLPVSEQSVFVDGTEWGELLALSGAPFVQGIETPTETSFDTLPTCGQCFTYPFYLNLTKGPAPPPQLPVDRSVIPAWGYSFQNFSWNSIWTYRRVESNTTSANVEFGDVSNQNWGGGNDFQNAYLFLPAGSGLPVQQPWVGGINLTSLYQAELTAYGWMLNYTQSASGTWAGHLKFAPDIAGTHHGLSKVPYIRDTRRSIGLGDFRLLYTDLTGNTSSVDTNVTFGRHFHDTVALGDYFYADSHLLSNSSCDFPSYITRRSPVVPYYIPFRSLTNKALSNTLMAGKTMAQTFHANSATRLHPVEWSSGVAAGVSAALMVMNGWDAQAAYKNVQEIQKVITESFAPLTWTVTTQS